MQSTHTIQTKLKDETEEVMLTGRDKREIIIKTHFAHVSNILTVLLMPSCPSSKQEAFEFICDQVPSFMEDYKCLRLFDQIKELKSKKDMIQSIVRDYTNQVIDCSKFLSLAHFVTVISRAEDAFGLKAFINAYQQIKASKEFPTFLEVLDTANDELRLNMRGLDILLHLPEAISSRPEFRTAIVKIDAEFKKLQKGPSQDKKSEHTQERRRNTAGIPVVAQLFSHISDYVSNKEKYAADFKAYLTEISDHHRGTRSDLFFYIATGASVAKIAEILSRTPHAISMTDSFGNSALHLATICNSEQVMELLIVNGFSPSQRNAKGNTPLHFAVVTESEAKVKLLLDHGVNIQENNDDGYDPFILAMMGKKDNPVLSLLVRSSGFNHHKRY